MDRFWYYRWKYDLPRTPEPLVDRGPLIKRRTRRLDMGVCVIAFFVACLAVAIFHFTSF